MRKCLVVWLARILLGMSILEIMSYPCRDFLPLELMHLRKLVVGYPLSLQVIQNKAARTVTGLGWFTAQSELLRQCGWLSIKQLVEYHSLLLVFKVKNEKKPVYIHDILSASFSYDTRAASANNILENQQTSRETTKEGFVYRSSKSWNSLPADIKKEKLLSKFKISLKKWIHLNVPA